MVKPFSPEQEALLSSLVPGLKLKIIGLQWGVSFSHEGTRISANLRHKDINYVELGWGKATKADFNKFVQYKLFTSEGVKGMYHQYTLDDVEILRAHERGFDFPDPLAPVQTVNNFSNNSFTGITNISSPIENSTQFIQNAATLDEDFKATFNRLVGDIAKVVADVPSEHKGEVETLETQVERLAEDVAKPKRNSTQVQITLDGLKKAAENLAKLVPAIGPIILPLVLELTKQVIALGSGS
jgi:hypothetical protein